MKLGSLFDGSGTCPLAASAVGIIPAWASEIEPFPKAVTQSRFPNMEHLGDITKIDGAKIEPVDVITFGSPCQNLSIAGNRKGLAGEQSSLFLEAVRVIREMRCAKGVLWGWCGDKSKSYGGAKYAVNGVPDIGADTMIGKCKDASSTGWDKLDPGEVVWTTGHIGVYIGNGLAVECTPKWKNCVQITAVGNIGKKPGYNARTWKKHGHLPYVTYDTTAAPSQPETVKPTPTSEVKATGVAKSFNKAVAGSYTVTAAAGLNVRDAAGVSSKLLVTIPKGTVVRNYGYYTVVGGVKWLYVQFTYKRITYVGFCSSAYLKK